MNLVVMAASGGATAAASHMSGQMGSMNSEEVRTHQPEGRQPPAVLLTVTSIAGWRQQPDPGAAGGNRHADTRGRR